MTVQTTTSSIKHVADSGQLNYSFDFLVLSESHVFIYISGLPYYEGFSVTGVGDANGGTIVLDNALDSALDNETLLISRIIPVTQETDYLSYDGFPAESHERGLDKLTLLIQQNITALSKTIRVSEGDPVSGDDLIIPLNRTDKLITFDSDGKLVLVDQGDGTGGGGSISFEDETEVLVDGQTNVAFSVITVSTASFFLVGSGTDQGILHEDTDYTLNVDGLSIDLVTSYPAGTKVYAAQNIAIPSTPGTSGVTSFENRVGDVIALLGDYTADEVLYDNTVTSLVAATEQEAIDELHGLIVNTRNVYENQIGDFRTSDTQSPSGLGDANKVIVHYGAGGNTSGNEFSLGADGILTCNANSKQYRFNLVISYIRSGSAGISELLTRMMYAPNGIDFVQVGGTSALRINDTDTVWREEFAVMFSPAVGSKLKIEVARNNGSVDAGDIGIYQPSGDLTGWNPAPSALLRIFNIIAE